MHSFLRRSNYSICVLDHVIKVILSPLISTRSLILLQLGMSLVTKTGIWTSFNFLYFTRNFIRGTILRMRCQT